MAKRTLDSPLGKIVASADERGICTLDFTEEALDLNESNHHLDQLSRELKEYFEGKRRVFDVALNPVGTSFQKSVWDVLLGIRYGESISYSEEAERLNHPKATRAVANANGKNPIPIIIPCHRVIAKGGGIGGYSGGLWRKEFLLNLEKQR